MTYIEAINAVLLRIRLSPVSSWDASDYSKLIGQLVNEAKREVEDAHEWHTLRTYALSALIGQGATVATFNGTGDRTRVIRLYNNTEDSGMLPKARNQIVKYRNIGAAQTGCPVFYALRGYDSTGNIEMELWPTSDGSYTITMDAINPQSDLSSNEDRIEVAAAPVRLRALALALAERGDDQGQAFAQVMSEYQIALTDAVNRDKDNGPDHEAWYVA